MSQGEFKTAEAAFSFRPEGQLMNQQRITDQATYVKQVGGDHYQQEKGLPQHWDLAIMYMWDPFQYQITKYVMRWKDKYFGNPDKQLEDLKKARSFLDKYIANFEKYLRHTELRADGSSRPISPESVWEAARAEVAQGAQKLNEDLGVRQRLEQERAALEARREAEAREAWEASRRAAQDSV